MRPKGVLTEFSPLYPYDSGKCIEEKCPWPLIRTIEFLPYYSSHKKKTIVKDYRIPLQKP